MQFLKSVQLIEHSLPEPSAISLPLVSRFVSGGRLLLHSAWVYRGRTCAHLKDRPSYSGQASPPLALTFTSFK